MAERVITSFISNNNVLCTLDDIFWYHMRELDTTFTLMGLISITQIEGKT